MRFRLTQPAHLVDINRIDGLAYVREENGSLCIGAFARTQTEQVFACIRQKLTTS